MSVLAEKSPEFCKTGPILGWVYVRDKDLELSIMQGKRCKT